jgi:hypothetical protein
MATQSKSKGMERVWTFLFLLAAAQVEHRKQDPWLQSRLRQLQGSDFPASYPKMATPKSS